MKKGQASVFVILLIVVAIILVIWGIVLFVPKGASPVTGNVVSDVFENCRDVQVPYEEIEYYTETVPYEEEIPLEYKSEKRDGWWGYQCGSLVNYKKCYQLEVMNIDAIGGEFIVNCNFETLYKNLGDNQKLYIKPGDTQTFKLEADVDIGEDTITRCNVEPPTKTKTRYKDVQRTRTVTKYRTEEKCD